MFSSVKSSGEDEADTAAVGNLRLRFLRWAPDVFVFVAPFFSCNGAGAVKRRCGEGRILGVGNNRVWKSFSGILEVFRLFLLSTPLYLYPRNVWPKFEDCWYRYYTWQNIRYSCFISMLKVK